MAEVALSHAALIAEIDATELIHARRPSGGWAAQLRGEGRPHGDLPRPYLADDAARQTPPLLRAEEITNASLCTGSHDHGDHIDPEAVAGIAAASPDCKFVVPNPHVDRIVTLGCPPDAVIGLRPDETAVVAGVKITGVKAKHESFDETHLGFPHLGYILEANGVCLPSRGGHAGVRGAGHDAGPVPAGRDLRPDQRPRRPPVTAPAASAT